MTEMDSLTVKFKIGIHTRRLSVPKTVLSTLDSLERCLCELEKELSGKRLTITWIDEEEEEVHVGSDAELKEAVNAQIAPGKPTVLKFTVTATLVEPAPQEAVANPEERSDSSVLMEPSPSGGAKAQENESQAANRSQGRTPQRPKKPTSVVEDHGSAKKLDSAYRYCMNFQKNDAVVFTGQEIEKRWCISNNGPSDWPAGCVLKPVGELSGFVITGKDQFVPLPPLAPGQETRVSVKLRAPETPGVAKIRFQAATGDNKEFGNTFTFRFTVQAKEGQEEDSCDDCEENYQSVESELKLTYRSITFDNGEVVSPLQEIKKTWSVRNTGNSAWPPGCLLKPSGKLSGFLVGDGSKSVPMPELAPKQQRNISVSLRAPETLGPATLNFRAFTKDQQPFGPLIKVKIDVQSAPTETTSEDAANFARTATPELTFRCTKTIKDNTVVLPLQEMKKTWSVRNTGEFAWPRGCVLKVFENPSGFEFAEEGNFVKLPQLPPGKDAFISVKIRAPATPGPATITFKAETVDKKVFGDLYVKVIVKEDSSLTGGFKEEQSAAPLSADAAFDLQWKTELDTLVDLGFTNLDRKALVTLMQKHLEIPSILRNNIVDQDRMNSLMNELADGV